MNEQRRMLIGVKSSINNGKQWTSLPSAQRHQNVIMPAAFQNVDPDLNVTVANCRARVTIDEALSLFIVE